MTGRDLRGELARVLAALPGPEGGVAIVIAVSGTPPAMAVLSTGDVLLEGDEIRVGVHASSSVVARLGEGLTLLVPLSENAVRVEVTGATASVDGEVAMVKGKVAALRRTAEPPWELEMRFRRIAGFPGDPSAHLDYWSAVRSWLEGSSPHAPPIPR